MSPPVATLTPYRPARRRRITPRRVLGALLAVGFLAWIGVVAYREAFPGERPDLLVLPTSDQRVEGDLRQATADGRRRVVTGRSGTVRFGFLTRNLQEEALRLRAAPGWAAELERRGIDVLVGWSPPRREVRSFDNSLGPLAPRDGVGFVVATYRISCGELAGTVDLTPRLEAGVGQGPWHPATRAAQGARGPAREARIVGLDVAAFSQVTLRRRRC